MDIEFIIGVIALILGIITVILELSNRIPRRYIKKFYYWLFNKKFKVKFKSIKNYPSLKYEEINMNSLKNEIRNTLREKNLVFEDEPLIGKNYIELSISDLQAPLYIEFNPIISEENEEWNEEFLDEGTQVIIKIKGIPEFVYRENLENRKNFILIEELFDIIEKSFDVKSDYVKHSLISTTTIFKEDWNKLVTYNEMETKIDIGKNVLMIESRRISPIYGYYKKYIPYV